LSICNCENFEKVWQNIVKKFQTRKGVIKHKRVTKELRRSKKLLQSQRKAGLASARKRLTDVSTPVGTLLQPSKEKESKGNVNEKESKALTNTSGLALSSSNSVRAAPIAPPMLQDFGIPRPAALERSIGAALYFNNALTNIIRPRSQSDRTCRQRPSW
jgi:hypothetical protein